MSQPSDVAQAYSLQDTTTVSEFGDLCPNDLICTDYICCRTYYPDLHALYAHFQHEHKNEVGKVSSTMFETGLEEKCPPENNDNCEMSYKAAGGAAATYSSETLAHIILAEELSAALDVDNIDVLTAVDQAIGEYGPGMSVKAIQPSEAGPSRSRKSPRRAPKLSFQLPTAPSSSAQPSSSSRPTKTRKTTPTPETTISPRQQTHQQWSLPLDPQAAAAIRAAHERRTGNSGLRLAEDPFSTSKKGKKRARDDKPYQCTYCGNGYRNPNGLKYHLTTSKQSPDCVAAHMRDSMQSGAIWTMFTPHPVQSAHPPSPPR